MLLHHSTLPSKSPSPFCTAGTFLHSHLKKFNAEVQELGAKLLQAALALHDKVVSTFRRTAINFHYEFTIRHLSQVFQGLLMSTPEKYNTGDLSAGHIGGLWGTSWCACMCM